jgi:ABC-type transport system involved in multi-copper enzyme maturation permease subunit
MDRAVPKAWTEVISPSQSSPHFLGLSQMYLHLITTWRLGLRGKSFLALVLLALFAMAGSLLASQFSGRQPNTVALDIGISAIRIIGALMALFWTQELFARDIEQRVLHTTLAYPSPRHHYVIGRFLGVALLLALVLALFGLMLAVLGAVAGLGYDDPSQTESGLNLVPVLGFLWLDLLTITAFAWLMATLSTTPFLPFALGLAFAWAGRSLGPVMGYLETGKGVMERMRGELHPLLEGFLWFLPDLSRLDLRPWVLYGQLPDSGVLALSAANTTAYIVLLMGLAIWRFNRREFA